MPITLKANSDGSGSLQVNGIDAVSIGSQGITQGAPAPFRNKIINGDMRIDQRNNGASITSSNNSFGVDRWKYQETIAGKFTIQQNQGGVTPPVGFTKYLGLQCNSATTLGASDNFNVFQVIEGQNMADLAWGTSGAQPVTVSFWVRSSISGQHSGSIRNFNATMCYPFAYTINAANTWEYKTVTIPGATSGTWDTGTGIGGCVWFDLGTGTNFRGAAGAWSTSNLTGVSGTVSVAVTSGATFQITGVQLEKGTVATPFEHRPIQTELTLCHRYARVIGRINTIGSNSRLIIPAVNTFRTTPTITIAAGQAKTWAAGTTVSLPTWTVGDTDGSAYSNEAYGEMISLYGVLFSAEL